MEDIKEEIGAAPCEKVDAAGISLYLCKRRLLILVYIYINIYMHVCVHVL
jgi:hypothetical protein